MTQFIVAEVHKNWRLGRGVHDDDLIANKFEALIEVNRLRGYRLYQFQLHRMLVSDIEMNETIVAVFVVTSGVVF